MQFSWRPCVDGHRHLAAEADLHDDGTGSGNLSCLKHSSSVIETWGWAARKDRMTDGTKRWNGAVGMTPTVIRPSSPRAALDELTEVRLLDVETLRCPRDVPLVGHHDEVAHLPNVDCDWQFRMEINDTIP